MARRKADAKLMAALILIGIPLFLLAKLYEALGPAAIATIVIGIPVLLIFVKVYRTRQRQRELMTKYHDAVIVEKIMEHNVWLGQTAEQLRDALQSPIVIDNHQLKTKRREVWKYHRRGVNRYGLRITLDNDVVVSWDQKNN